MRSFREAPIAPYGVTIEHDGCHRGDVALPEGWGTREQCAAYIASHLPPKGYEFGIVHIDSGRQVSFMIPPHAGRRIRLRLQDFTLA
jgi:hypothetical protein